jgi:hypothetical protein
MEPGDYQDTPLSQILHFIRSVGLLQSWNKEGCTIDHDDPGASAGQGLSLIHSFNPGLSGMIGLSKVQDGQGATIPILNTPCGNSQYISNGSVCALSCSKQPDVPPCAVWHVTKHLWCNCGEFLFHSSAQLITVVTEASSSHLPLDNAPHSCESCVVWQDQE